MRSLEEIMALDRRLTAATKLTCYTKPLWCAIHHAMLDTDNSTEQAVYDFYEAHWNCVGARL